MCTSPGSAGSSACSSRTSPPGPSFTPAFASSPGCNPSLSSPHCPDLSPVWSPLSRRTAHPSLHPWHLAVPGTQRPLSISCLRRRRVAPSCPPHGVCELGRHSTSGLGALAGSPFFLPLALPPLTLPPSSSLETTKEQAGFFPLIFSFKSLDTEEHRKSLELKSQTITHLGGNMMNKSQAPCSPTPSSPTPLWGGRCAAESLGPGGFWEAGGGDVPCECGQWSQTGKGFA